MDDYVELRARSAFSFLEGASLPEDLAARAAELGYKAIALGDRDGVYGQPRFHQAAVNDAPGFVAAHSARRLPQSLLDGDALGPER